MTSVVIADDHPFLRAGLEAVLRSSGIDICASANDGNEALVAVAAHNPDVVILDVQMPQRDGISVLEALRGRGDDRPVILLTAALDDSRLVAAVRAKVNGIVFKQGAEQHLIDTIRKVASGETVIPADLLLKAQELIDRGGPTDLLEALAPRERQITEAVARGMRNREIASHLGMTEGSIKVYLNRIFDKLGVENRTELAIRIHEQSRGSNS
ncbi:response regulator [Novosphingobium sp.]|uniref:response regulator n=1 Tax=Novosphingobium sp. TaxID=1874826 RepID=UPI0035AF571D